jgi:hypothetical protein
LRASLALSIGAVAAVALGIPLALAPAQVLSTFGVAVPNEGLILARDAGVLLIGLGVIDWMAREAVGDPLRGLLWGNIVISGWGRSPTTAGRSLAGRSRRGRLAVSSFLSCSSSSSHWRCVAPTTSLHRRK